MSTSQIITTVIAAFAAIGGTAGILAFFKARPEIRKLNADAASVIAATAVSLLEPAEKRADKLATEVERLTAEVALQTGHARKANERAHVAEETVDRLSIKVRSLETKVNAMTDRLDLANRLLTAAGIPFPPTPEVGV